MSKSAANTTAAIAGTLTIIGLLIFTVRGFGAESVARAGEVELRTAYLDTPIAGGRLITIKGKLGGKGELTLNPNHIQLEDYGDPGVTTLIGFTPIPVEIRSVKTEKSDPAGRLLYELESARLTKRLRLVISPKPADAARLLELDGQGKVIRVVTLENVSVPGPSPGPRPSNRAAAPRAFKYSILGAPSFRGYEIKWNGDALEYRKRSPLQSQTEAKTITPSAEQWERFWGEMDAIRVWDWRPSYVNANVLDGSVWELSIERGNRRIACSGRNGYPDDDDVSKVAPFAKRSRNYDRLIAALKDLVGAGAFE